MTTTDDADLAALFAAGSVEEPDEAERARRRRRRRIGWVSALVVLLLVAGGIGGYVALALNAPLPTASVVLDPLAAPAGPAVALALPEASAAAVAVTGTGGAFAGDEVLDGRILAVSGTAEPLPMASISKLVTALVVLDAHPIGAGEAGPTITFTEADDDLYDRYYLAGATIQSLRAGSRMALHDALEMMLVVSASNYAEATSTWAFGSTGAFARAADAWLAEQGLTRTTVVEPTGLDRRNTSTSADLITLGRIALANPGVAEITRMASLDVPGFDRQRNNNTLLGSDGVDGLKTGTLEGFGSNLLFSAQVRAGEEASVAVVGVVLGAANRDAVNASVRALLASIADGYHFVPVVERGQAVGEVATAWGERARIVATRDASLPTWSDAPLAAAAPTATVSSTGANGDEVGEVVFSAGARTVEVPLALDGDLSPPDDWWRLTHPQLLFG